MENKKNEKVVAEEPKVQPEKPALRSIFNDLKYELVLLEKAFSSKDSRQIIKITKSMRKYKKHLKAHHFAKIFEAFYPEKKIDFQSFADYNEAFVENLDIAKNYIAKLAKMPELELFLNTLFLIYLVQTKKLQQALELVENLLQKTKDFNKRYLDYLLAFIYFYYSRIYELLGRHEEIKNNLYDAYRSACLHKDEIGQAVVLNLLLRNLLTSNNFEAAQNLVSKTNFPESKSNNELVRYLFYTGKIKAVEMEYSESFSRLMQAIRKAPDTSALGFRVQAQKLAIVVELLMGEIPTRSIFSQPEVSKFLFPYFSLVQSVLKGNMADFQKTLTTFQRNFVKDKNYTLVNRLHHLVVKTGLRKINLSYSRISIADVAQKLNLDQKSDVEFIIAKCIRDGVINAKIDHENKHLIMEKSKDFYSTEEPQRAFEKRITYCMNLYQSSTKALQYPYLKSKYAERDGSEEISPEEFLKMVEDDDF